MRTFTRQGVAALALVSALAFAPLAAPAAAAGILAPEAPTALTATRAADANAFDLAWAPSVAVDGNPVASYTVEVSSATDGLLSSNSVTSTFYRASGLEIGESYTFTVTAVAENDEDSDAASITKTLLIKVPLEVTNVVLTQSNGTLSASWSAPAYSGGGDVYYDVYLWENGALVSNENAISTSYTFATNVQYGVPYYALVRAYNVGGGSTVGTESNTVFAAYTTPGAPTALTATRAADANAFDLSWAPSVAGGGNAVVSYTVEVSSATDGFLESTEVTTTSYRASDLQIGEEYTFTVTAVAENDEQSDAATTTRTLLATMPLEVTNIVLTQSNGTLSATWTAPAYSGGGVLNYDVYLYASGNLVGNANATSTSHTLATTAQSGVPYYVVIRAYGAGGTTPGAASNTVTRGSAPDAPVALPSADGYKDPMIYTSWSPETLGTDIEWIDVTLYDSLGAVVETQHLNAGTGVTGAIFYHLPNDTDYTVGVTFTNSGGTSPESTRAPIRTNGATPPAYTADQLDAFGNFAGVTVSLTGSTLTAHLDGVDEGTWVFGYAHSTPTALGWAQVNAAGFVSWSISGAGLPSGAHRIAVLDSFGGLYGSAAFTVGIAPAALPRTGTDSSGWGTLAVALLALGAVAVIASARRKARTGW